MQHVQDLHLIHLMLLVLFLNVQGSPILMFSMLMITNWLSTIQDLEQCNLFRISTSLLPFYEFSQSVFPCCSYHKMQPQLQSCVEVVWGMFDVVAYLSCKMFHHDP